MPLTHIDQATSDDIILAAKYTEIKTMVISILGVGLAEYGYGQTISAISSKVSGDIVTVDEWVKLRSDIIRCRQHQTGVVITETDFPIPSTDTSLSLTAINDNFITYANQIYDSNFETVETECNIARLAYEVRSSEWNGSTPPIHSLSISGVDSNSLRFFFNAGGTINFSAALSDATPGKNEDWHNMLNDMGTIKFGAAQTIKTGTRGTASNVGWYDLVLADTDYTIFTISSIAYPSNVYSVKVRRNDLSTILSCSITFLDGNTVAPDTNISGILYSEVTHTYANSENVAVDALIPSNSTLVGGDPTPTFSIVSNSADIYQGDSISVTFTANQISPGTTLTYDITGFLIYNSTNPNITKYAFTNKQTGSTVTLVNGTSVVNLTASKMYRTVTEINCIINFRANNVIVSSIPLKIRTIPTTENIYGVTGTYSLTVPNNVSSIRINLVGGGGAGTAVHDSDYGTYAWAGAPGGGVNDLDVSVTPGDIISIVVGKKGGSAKWNGGDWIYSRGTAGTDSSISINGSPVCIAYAGTSAGSKGPAGAVLSTPGHVYSGYLGGLLTAGTVGGKNSGKDVGYSVWNYSSPACGKQSITPPSTVPSYKRAGLSEYPGWCSIKW